MKDYSSLSKEELIQIIEKLESRKKYGLIWDEEKVPEKVVVDCKDNLPVLSEVKNKEIITNESLQTNILIEGDNYHALSVLNYTHKGKIDLIYIDPPYNTGAKDFVYNDKYVEKDDTWRHSKWVNFMSKRLELSRALLKNEGIIFISINEEEQAQLKLLCDEIFGVDNYLTMFSVKVRHEDRILKGDKDFHEVIEYLFLYRKSNSFKTIKRVLDNTSIDDYVYEIEELINNPKIVKFGKKEVQVFKPNQYKIKKGEPGVHKVKKINIRGSIKEGNSSGRFFMKYLADKLGNELGYLYKVPDIGDDGIGFRYFYLPEKLSRTNGDYFQGVPLDKSDEKEIPFANFMDFEYDFNNVDDLNRLYNIYLNASADDYECPTVVTDKNHTSCGQSRFGCWTCTVVKEDKSMSALIKNGQKWLEPLLDYRNRLVTERNISSNRSETRRNGNVAVTEDGNNQGNYTPEYRARLLRQLLSIQKKIQSQKPLIELISNQELIAIQVYWYRDGIFDYKVGEIYSRIYGRDIDTENVIKEKSNEVLLLKSVCGNNQRDYELINSLLMLQHSKTLLLTNYGLQNDIENRLESFIKEAKDEN